MLCCLAGTAQAAASLCTKAETTYFNCTANTGKIISLCGQVDEGDEDWLQYRYGRPGAAELVFPSSRKESVGRFTVERIRANGGQVGIDALAFVSGGIGYSLQYVIPDSAPSWHGLSVGDPRDFGLDRGSRPRSRYPRAELRCSKGGNQAAFSDLVQYLEGR